MNKRPAFYMQNKRQGRIHTKKVSRLTLPGRHILWASFIHNSPIRWAVTRCPTHKNTKGKPFDFDHDGKHLTD